MDNNVFIDHSPGEAKEPLPLSPKGPQFLSSNPQYGFRPIAKKDERPVFPDAPYDYAERNVQYHSVQPSQTYDEYDYEPTEPYHQGRGQIGDESYDRENKEENGLYQENSYREPIRSLSYDEEEPIDVQQYGNDYAGLETYQGGYDSEDDAKRGIVRSYHTSNVAPENIYIEEEPVEDYNQEGYYVPRERSHRERTHGSSLEARERPQDVRQTEEDMPNEKPLANPYHRYRAASRPIDRYEELEEEDDDMEEEKEEKTTSYSSVRRRRPASSEATAVTAAPRPKHYVRHQRHQWSWKKARCHQIVHTYSLDMKKC